MSDDPYELTRLFQQLRGSGLLNGMASSVGASGHLILLLVAVLSAIAVLRPRQIVRFSSFRRAFWLVGLAVLVEPLTRVLFNVFGMNAGSPTPGGGGFVLLLLVFSSLPTLLTGLAVLALANAIVPKFLPQQHPDRDRPEVARPVASPPDLSENRRVPEGLP